MLKPNLRLIHKKSIKNLEREAEHSHTNCSHVLDQEWISPLGLPVGSGSLEAYVIKDRLFPDCNSRFDQVIAIGLKLAIPTFQ